MDSEYSMMQRNEQARKTALAHDIKGILAKDLREIARDVIRKELRIEKVSRCPAPKMPIEYYLQVKLGEEVICEEKIGDDGYEYDG